MTLFPWLRKLPADVTGDGRLSWYSSASLQTSKHLLVEHSRRTLVSPCMSSIKDSRGSKLRHVCPLRYCGM
jgi:hypothetical protein